MPEEKKPEPKPALGMTEARVRARGVVIADAADEILVEVKERWVRDERGTYQRAKI